MRKVTIVGGGQCGLMVACGLVQQGYEVRVISNRTGEEIKNGRVLSSQGMMQPAVDAERELGLRFWEGEYPYWDGLQFNVLTSDSQKAVSFAGRPPGQFESIDQRVKMPRWMQAFEDWGGELIIEEAGMDDLERYAEQSDLVLVASGKGEIGRLFERDAEKSPYDKPMRALALTYVKGMEPIDASAEGLGRVRGLSWNGLAGVGEYFCCHALTTSGECEIMIFEGVPGGPMDCWGDVKTPEEHMAKSKWVLETFFPHEAERCRNIELTDDNGLLAGRFPPTIRKPVATLPSGRPVFGIGDTVCLNDPLTGQGANNAAKFAKVVYDSILARGEAAFDTNWMQSTFDDYWEQAKHVVKWTNSLLVPPPEAAMMVLGAAGENTAIADQIFSGFNDASVFEPWFYDSAAAQEMIQNYSAAA